MILIINVTSFLVFHTKVTVISNLAGLQTVSKWRDHYWIKQTCKPYTLAGPTVTRPVVDPLAVNTSTTDYICCYYEYSLMLDVDIWWNYFWWQSHLGPEISKCFPKNVTNIFFSFQQFYLFDHKALCDPNTPVDRGCHACGRPGHFVRECPVVRQAEERKRNKATNRRRNGRWETLRRN